MARFRFSFWLDSAKDDDRAVGKTIADLKRQRAFSAVVRDGIMIVCELRQGRCDLLLKLYPWIADAVKEPAPPPAPDTSGLERKIEQLQQAIMNQGVNLPASPSAYPLMQSGPKTLASGTGKQIIAPVITMPTFDDDDQDTVIVRTDASAAGQGAAAFMDSVLSLQAPTAQQTSPP